MLTVVGVTQCGHREAIQGTPGWKDIVSENQRKDVQERNDGIRRMHLVLSTRNQRKVQVGTKVQPRSVAGDDG